MADGVGIHLFSAARAGLTVDPVTGERHPWRLAAAGFNGAQHGTESPSTGRFAFEGNVSTKGREFFGSDRWCVFVTAPDGLTRGAMRAPAAARLLDIGAPQTELIGWVDRTHVLVRVWASSERHFMATQQIGLLDIRSASVRTMIRVDGRQETIAHFATDLISRPFIKGVAPPSVRDPRVTPGIVLGVTGAGLVLTGLVWLYRRDRRFVREAHEAVRG